MMSFYLLVWLLVTTPGPDRLHGIVNFMMPHGVFIFAAWIGQHHVTAKRGSSVPCHTIHPWLLTVAALISSGCSDPVAIDEEPG
jgi:hypothetical protein